MKEPEFKYRLKYKYTEVKEAPEIYPETGEIMYRPKINYVKVVLWIVLTLAIDGALTFGILFGCSYFDWYKNIQIHYAWQFVILYFCLLIIFILIMAKRIVIFCIRFYQKYGSYRVRARCLFIPNCSEYMILAIKKYGLIRGVRKGIKRYHRCLPPNGGIDYP